VAAAKAPARAKGAARPSAEAPAPRGATRASAKHPAAADALFPAAVDAAIERGSASLVLLKRKLNVGYERAEGLMEALVAEGIVGEMTASGSRPTLATAQAWKAQRAR
jgi:S-DNA-T family DNA segregation ATPase FtsK/SpoIIIE